MSNILKGILNESNPFYGHNDPAREYGAEDPSYPKRGRHSQTDDDEYDPYGLIRQEKDFAKGRAMKAAAEKAQRDSDHDRLATGTNEGLDDPWGDQGNFAGDKPVNLGNVSMKNIQTGDTVKYLGQPSKIVAMSKDRKHSRIAISKGMGTITQDVLTSDLQQLGQGKTIEENDNIQTRMRMNDYYDLADAIQEKLKQAIKMGNKELIQKLNKERDDLDARVKKYGLMPESEQLDEISNEKLSQYKTAAAADAGKADKEGDYKRGDKRFSGIVKATKKQFANDTKKSGISQGINEFSPGATGPKGPKDYGQPNSSRYIGGNKFVVGTTNNYVLTATIDKWGLEWDEDDEIWFLDSPGAAHIADASEGEIELPPPREQRNQIHDLVTDYLNARNSADLQKVAAYYGHSDDGEMATNESVSEAPRFNSKQEIINHFVKNGKSAAAGAAAWERGYRGSSKKPIELKKPPQRSYHDELDDKRYSTFENLGDQLKSTSLNALVQAKLAIEKQREAEIEAWKQDFEKNTVQKAQQELNKGFQPTPVAQPGEKHSVLKARLAQLNSAIQKQELLDKLVDRLERKGLLTPAMQNDTDTRMHVRYGSKDNYESLNKKLDNAIQALQSRLNIRKISGLKEQGHDERDEYDNPRQGRDYGKGNLFVDPGSNEFEKNVPASVPGGPRGAPKNLKGISKALPADAFGRTTGKIPAGKRGTVHSKMGNTDEVDEGWSQKYKNSINCSHPKGFSQKAHCAGKKKHNESIDNVMEMTCPDCGMCETHGDNSKDQLDELKCWSGYHRVAGTKAGFPGSCAKNKTNESEHSESCPHCGGEMVSEELMNEKKDACYYKVKSRYKVWPSAYASGALVKCRNKGAKNWGNSSKNESSILEGIEQADESLHDWFNKEKWVRMDTKGKIKGPCAREPGEGKPKCLPQSKAHSLGKKGRASAAQRKRREDPNPERSGKAINVDTKKK